MFGFSTENWSRPQAEVSEMLGLMKAYFASDLGRLERERRQGAHRRPPHRPRPATSSAIVEEPRRARPRNDRFHLQVAFNYGGRADIADAARKFAEQVGATARPSPDDLDEAAVRAAAVDLAGGRRPT